MDSEKYIFYLKKLKEIGYSHQDHWDIFDEKYYEKINSIDSMKNFRINGISNMLETGLPSQDRQEMIESGREYSIDYSEHEIEEVKKRYGELVLMLGDDINLIEFNSAIGNPRRYSHVTDGDERLLNFDDLYHVYAAWQIRRFVEVLLENRAPDKILEIGAGYGNLAQKLKSLFPKTKYVIIDLPEVLLLQHYYLSKNNPDYKIVNLVGDSGPSLDSVDDLDCDFLLVPFGMYGQIDADFDVIVNNRSFGEMPKETLENYIEYIQSNIKTGGFLYTVNRYVFTKSVDKNKIRDYPLDRFWKIIVSQPQWLQTHLHEFLLQRVEKETSPSLEFLLKSFPITTPPPGPIMEKIQTQLEWMKHQKVK